MVWLAATREEEYSNVISEECQLLYPKTGDNVACNGVCCANVVHSGEESVVKEAYTKP